MREVTKQMIKDFKIYEKGMDFMGYHVNKRSPLSYHHTIISHRECLKRGLGEGYWYENGSILVQDSSHDFLHVIEAKDLDMFYDITSSLIDENALGRLDLASLRRIHDILTQFEREHCSDRTNKGKPLIKERFVKERIKL